jgi:hypothetical protein
MLKTACAAIILIVCLLATGCSSTTSSPGLAKIYNMGERVQVGTLIYTVLDTEWLDQLGDGPSARMPRNRFLTVRVSVTNSGAAVSAIPPMTLTTSGGQDYTELTDAPGVPEWLGYIRSVKAAETVHGRAAFDVPAGAYQLHLSNDAEPENTITARVELPLQLSRPQVMPGAIAGQ